MHALPSRTDQLLMTAGCRTVLRVGDAIGARGEQCRGCTLLSISPRTISKATVDGKLFNRSAIAERCLRQFGIRRYNASKRQLRWATIQIPRNVERWPLYMPHSTSLYVDQSRPNGRNLHI
jgi:hypothetical protein